MCSCHVYVCALISCASYVFVLFYGEMRLCGFVRAYECVILWVPDRAWRVYVVVLVMLC